jgi:hypothetical protein
MDLNTVNEYCFVSIEANPSAYNAPAPGRYLCTPRLIGFQIGVSMNDGRIYSRGHNWSGFSDWKVEAFQ